MDNQQGVGTGDYGYSNCTFHDNYFINNTELVSDGLPNNQWYNNSWSDYNGTGPYVINGEEGVSDPFPGTVDIDIAQWENQMGSNIAAVLDQDGDGMPNLWEYQMGLDASDPSDAALDKDGDGMPNLWEYQMGLDASDPSDAALDKDGDLVSNVDEYRGGSDPRDLWSVPLLGFSLVHLLLVTVAVLVTVLAAVITHRILRAVLVSRLQAPDHETALKIMKTGYKDHAAYERARNLAGEYFEDGNGAFTEGDLDTAVRCYEMALTLFERLDDSPMIAETVFNTARVMKERGTLTTGSLVLERFPASDGGDPVIEKLRAKLESLLATTGKNGKNQG
ncbi:MAG: hypothetical protein ACXAEU_02540 [Candidatus Hodarchaeales archaeon]